MLALLVTLQAATGITTLVLNVPLTLALLHQAGAIVVLAIATVHMQALRGGAREAATNAAFTPAIS